MVSMILLIGCGGNRTKVTDEKKVEKEFSQTYYKCEKERGETAVGMSSCLEEELIYQDAKLNKNYREAKKSIQPFRREELKKVQKIWINYRDEKCNFFNHKESGSSGSIDAQICQIKETISRAKELKEIF